MTEKETAEQRVVKAIEAARQGDETLSFKLLVSAVDMDTSCASGWYHLGLKFQAVKKYGSASACFRKAMEFMPQGTARDRAVVLTNIGYNLHLAARTAEGLPFLEEATRLDPALALPWIDIAQVYGVLGRYEKSYAAAKTGFDIAPEDPKSVLTYAFSLFHQGDYGNAFRYYEARFQYRLPEVLTYPMPMWKGEAVNKLMLVAEQGAGDTIMMLRFVRQAAARAKKTVFMTHPSTIEIARLNLPPTIEIVGMPSPIPEADAFSTLMSLPVALGFDPKKFEPYVWWEPSREKKKGFHVGFAWAGDPEHDCDHWRSISVTEYLPLIETRNVVGHSLQVGARAKDVGEQGLFGLLKDESPNITNFADTARIISDLDLVVTVDTAVAHLAGAMGKRVWLLVNQQGQDWRWPREGSETIWYPSMTIFKKELNEEWRHVIARMVAPLEKISCRASPT